MSAVSAVLHAFPSSKARVCIAVAQEHGLETAKQRCGNATDGISRESGRMRVPLEGPPVRILRAKEVVSFALVPARCDHARVSEAG